MMAKRRIRNRPELRKGWREPPGPNPEDFVGVIKEWLEDGRTKARQALQVVDQYDVDYLWAYCSRPDTRNRPIWASVIGPPLDYELWVCWPLPPEYRVAASHPNDGRQKQVVCSENARDQPSAEDDGAENEEAGGPTLQVILRIGINDEFKLWVKFLSPDENALLLELDIDEDVQLDPESVELHDRYLFEQMACGEGFEVVEHLDVFEADSASFLKEVLARFGIDLYCPVTSIGDALPRSA
ncbi:MAG TPA: hypothetical protein PK867_11860 [Pirellulales bacterium]|nr:hypothetical protein [Pirellulales bacterium]